jgi:Memo-like protein
MGDKTTSSLSSVFASLISPSSVHILLHPPRFLSVVVYPPIMSNREASHAGSWYSSSAPELTAQLDQWLEDVPQELPGVGKTPVPGARVIISPHAGFAYSAPCAAWAYRSLDLSTACVDPRSNRLRKHGWNEHIINS